MNSVCSITPISLSPDKISDIQSLMRAGIESGAVRDAVPEMRLEHSFIPGAYARQLWRPKGTLIVGKIHRHPCFNFLMTGRLTVWDEAGTRDISAPYFFVSPGGQRRVTFAHEDSLLICVHGTNETELDKLEAELILEDTDVQLENLKQFIDGVS